MISNATFDRERDFVLRGLPFKPAGAFLAGGAITSTFTSKPISDYDLYFKSKDDFIRAVESAYDDGMWCVACTSRAITFASGDLVVQMMHFAFFATAEAIFEAFDFTCCMAAVDLDSDSLELHPTFLSDTSKRQLVFNHRTAYPIASALRVLKYQDKGYAISKAELLKIATTCNLKPVSGWDELKEQVGGQYGESAALDTSNPFSLDSAIEALDKVGDRVVDSDCPGTADAALARIFQEQ